MKKIILSSTLALLTLGSFNIASANDSYSWSNLKKEIVQSSSDEPNVNDEKTKDYIEDTYGVSVDRKSVEQMRVETQQKSLVVSFLTRSPGTYTVEEGDSLTGYTYHEETQDFWGIGMEGKLDFSSLGKVTKNWFGEFEIYSDYINMGIVKKWFPFQKSPYSNEGFNVGAGVYMGYVISDGYREESTIVPSVAVSTAYNFENWQIGVNWKYDSDLEEAADGLTFNIGYRF